MEFESATRDGRDEYSTKRFRKGDLIIRSSWDNSIPGIVMDIIDNLDWYDYLPKIKELSIKNVLREHLG